MISLLDLFSPPSPNPTHSLAAFPPRTPSLISSLILPKPLSPTTVIVREHVKAGLSPS